jgi:hypothetical protein
VGPRNGRVNEGGGKARGLIAIKCDLREERKARERGQARPELRRRANGRSRGRKGEEEGRGRRRQVGPRCQRLRGKRKKEEGRRAAAGKGEVGRWAEKVRMFIFFLFQTLFKSILYKFKFKQNLSNFFTEFYKLFKLHTSNQKPCKAK